MLIEESLRETEFAYIEFRNSPVGRQAYLKNSNLAVWQVMMLGVNEKKCGKNCSLVIVNIALTKLQLS
jgi:hypothetical protein